VKALSVSVPERDYVFVKYALDQLASEVITDDEAGQRGNRRSILIRMIATAGFSDFAATAKLLKQIKSLTNVDRL
jgi:hypothetical protein